MRSRNAALALTRALVWSAAASFVPVCLATTPTDRGPAQSTLRSAPPVGLETPALTSGDGRTDQAELMRFVEQVAQAPHVYLLHAGRSPMGHEIPVLVFTRGAGPDPDSLLASGRPTVWVHAQQHGNEPASCEGALALAADLAGPSSGLIDAVNVVIVPRANPDGADRDSRYTSNGLDLNRDSMRQVLTESRLLRHLNLAYAPVLTIDAHEYRPERPVLQPFGVQEMADLMILGPENLNVPARLRDLTRDLLIGQARSDARAAGLSIDEYTITRPTLAGMAPHLVLGGADARIGRNYHGLLNQASVLLESRGIGLGPRDLARRTFAQWTVMRSLIATVAENTEQITTTLAEIRAETIARGARADDEDPVFVGVQELQPALREHRFVDSVSGEVRTLSVAYTGREQRRPASVRQRPLAYLLGADQGSAVDALEALGIRVHRLQAAVKVTAGHQRVLDTWQESRAVEGVYRRRVRLAIESRLLHTQVGAFLVPMDQPLANLAIEALEPDGEDSLFCVGLIDGGRGHDLPIYRITDPGAFAQLRASYVAGALAQR
ncbi:MAG: M14 family zinc carboxypeptidase [Burkholderiaceae bacterium]